MSADSMGWKIVDLLVLLLTLAVPTYVAYDLYGRGQSPEKHVELRQWTVNPLRDLSVLGDRATLSLEVDDQTIDNLIIAQAALRNIGSAPILPSDYHENLSVNVPSPWKIVAVESSDLFRPIVQLRWKRLSDTKFEAEPALLNPGDMVSAVVYLTNTDRRPSAADNLPEPKIEWNARITNLRRFYQPPDVFERIRSRTFLGISFQVELQGRSLAFTIVSALLFQAVYLRLLSRAEFLRDWGWLSICIILCASLLSFAAAECSATYLFGSTLTDMTGVDHRLNAPPIVLHVVALFYLYQKAKAQTAYAPKAS